jgi:glycosyltransferase involved in cell wall biosynthesis
MSKIRVLQLTFDFQIESAGGGVSRFAMDLCRALDRELFAPAICGLWNWGTTFEKSHIELLQKDGIEAFTAAPWDAAHPYQSFRQAQANLLTYLEQNPAHILHSHSEFSDAAALLARLRRRAPLIVRSVHYGYHVEWRKRPLRRLILTNILYPLFYQQEIGISRSIQERLDNRPAARLLRKKSLYLNNAINLERFAGKTTSKAELRDLLGLPNERFLIGSVGRLSEQKDYQTLVRAAAIVLQNYPAACFVQIGDGEQKQELEHLAAGLGLADRFIFLGRKAGIENYLAAMDLFVSSSLWEGLPTVILESMASGLPVVATDIPGTRDLIQPGVNGWLAPPGNPAALAQKISEALNSAELRASYAAQSRQVVNQFSIENVAEQHAKLYQQLIKTVPAAN